MDQDNFRKLSNYCSLLSGEDIHVTTNEVLPNDVRRIVPKLALTDGKRIFLPEVENAKEAKRMCLEKIIEIKTGYFSIPEEERPSFDEFSYTGIASTIFQTLENERVHNAAKKRFPKVFEGYSDEYRLVKNFLEVSSHLPRKNGKKLRKAALRYSRIAKKGKANIKTAEQHTKKIYNLLDLPEKQEEQEQLPEWLMNLLMLLGGGVPDCCADIMGAVGYERAKRDEIVKRASAMSIAAPDIEGKIDEIIQNQNIQGTYSTSSVMQELSKEFQNKGEFNARYVPNPNENSCQEKGLQFIESDMDSNSRGLNCYDSIKITYASAIQRLKRLFERKKGEDYKKLKRQDSGDEVDIDAAIDFVSSLKNGEQPELKVYQGVKRDRRDVGAGILVDMSGSMCGEKIERAKETLVILSESLDHIGDDFSIFGFTGDYPIVRMFHIKAFGEKLSPKVKARIGNIKSNSNNRDGAAIRYMTDYVSNVGHKTKILFVVSDGSPADGNYGNAMSDTRNALLETKARGIKPYCITIDSRAIEYIDRLYGQVANCICPNPAELPEKAGNFYTKIAF